MRNKNEVFEYLIDKLRQQVNGKDATSFNVSVQISDLDEVKQVIHNLQQHIAGKDDEIRGLKDTLRQQLTNNPYRQQCEDLAHEVQSLKNRLRDASAQIKELNREVSVLANAFPHEPEQSGCRKEDAQGCAHNWIIMPGLFLSEGNPNNVPGSELCAKCGKREWDNKEYKPKNDTQECRHEWRAETFYGTRVSPTYCRKCGATK